ncbi:MAG: hypothetical protein BWY31_04687 [Lentisphaerae bacterium ADurb.Bin242]|nr:MAG: hypothetical protein BWY31_04687 [Lentisphaerae bacterium ADurb.Bin242]
MNEAVVIRYLAVDDKIRYVLGRQVYLARTQEIGRRFREFEIVVRDSHDKHAAFPRGFCELANPVGDKKIAFFHGVEFRLRGGNAALGKNPRLPWHVTASREHGVMAVNDMGGNLAALALHLIGFRHSSDDIFDLRFADAFHNLHGAVVELVHETFFRCRELLVERSVDCRYIRCAGQCCRGDAGCR